MSKLLINQELIKICSKCKEIKPLNEFYKHKHGKYGVDSKCKTCVKKYDKQHKLKNKDKIKQQNKQYRFDNPFKQEKWILEHPGYLKQWNFKHRDEINQRANQRYENDIIFRIGKICRSMVNVALNGNPKYEHTMTYFMCSNKNFREHIEKQWEPWMNWNNRGNGLGKWNIDHIIPVSFFNMLDPVEIYMCCRYQNLRPISWEANMTKGKKVILTLV